MQSPRACWCSLGVRRFWLLLCWEQEDLLPFGLRVTLGASTEQYPKTKGGSWVALWIVPAEPGCFVLVSFSFSFPPSLFLRLS